MPPRDTFEPSAPIGLHGKSSWTNAGLSVREHIHYTRESERLTEHQMEMSFLRHLMLYDDTNEHHELESKVTQAEGKVRCARRAVWVMALLAGLAVAGLGYSAVLLEDFPQNRTQFVIRMFCALGLASLVSLLSFIGYWIIARGELDDQRGECRRLVARIMESHLGKPATVSSLEIVKTQSSHSAVAAETSPAAS